eukprot:4802197-Amphidinium_carterae.1
MAGIVDAKVMRTLLLAQPGLGNRLLDALSLAQRVDLLLAGLRSSGLIGLANTQYAQSLKSPKPAASQKPAASPPATAFKGDRAHAPQR